MPSWCATTGRYQRAMVPAAAAGIAFLVYLLTLAPDLTWANHGGDGGELITAAVTLGVPHPPGYPTYVLLGKGVSWLPLGTVAWRFNLFSALGMAVATAFVAASGRRLAGGMAGLPALAAALSFAFAPLVWGQALIAEVYALNAAFVAATTWSLLNRRSPALSGFLAGLAITAHLTSLLLLPLLLLLTPWRRWPRLALGLLAGLLPFLALPLLARGGSPVVWGDPTTPANWWRQVSAALYRPNVAGLPASALWPRLRAWLPALLWQWAGLGWPLLAVATTTAWAKQRRTLLGLLLAALLFGLFALGYDGADAGNYFIPGLLLLSILLTSGLQRLGRFALVLPLLLLTLNFSGQSLRADLGVRAITGQTLSAAPPEAILLTPGDPTLFALWYFHYVEGQRPDIILVDSNLLAFTWYRQRMSRFYPTLEHLASDDLQGFIEANQTRRPVCAVNLETPEQNHCFNE